MPSVRCLTSPAFVVRATTIMVSASRAPEMNTFCPFSVQPPSALGVARVVIAKLLVPALGSVMAKHIFFSPVQVGVTYLAICSRVPLRTMGTRARPVTTRNSVGTPASARASFRAVISSTPPPEPPYSSGIDRPSRPNLPRACQSSSGKRSSLMH